jgi:hypothetical protein
MPSSRKIVQNARPIELYLAMFGVACCLVFTVSIECMIKSADEPPKAPEIAAFNTVSHGSINRRSITWSVGGKFVGHPSWRSFSERERGEHAEVVVLEYLP